MKNNFYRWLESMGQNPQTVWMDLLMYVVKGVLLLFLMTLPIAIATPLMRGAKLVGPPGTTPNFFVFVFMAGFSLYVLCVFFVSNRYFGCAPQLSKIFPAPKNFNEGEVFHFQSGTIGGMSYNSVLLLRVA